MKSKIRKRVWVALVVAMVVATATLWFGAHDEPFCTTDMDCQNKAGVELEMGGK